MAPELFHFEYDPSPAGFPALLRRVWLWLYPQGEDPVFKVYREKLADFVHEYQAEVFLSASSMMGSLFRSAKGGPTSTPEQAILYAAVAALVDLRQQEVEMQTHPGLSKYPTLTAMGNVRFPPDSACDHPDVHLSRYVIAQYELILSLAEELARSREALASLSNAQSPPPSPLPPVPTPAPSITLSLQTPSVPPVIPVVTRREVPEEWSPITATPAAPMLSPRIAPSFEEGPPRKRRFIGSSSRSMVHEVSSGSEGDSDDSDNRRG
jgi:hypothetical protein